MAVNGSVLLAIALLLLLPLVPTLIIYKVIRDKRARAGARGTLFGLKIETSGAIATYVICAVLGLLIAQKLIIREYIRVQMSIQVSGDPEAVDRFIEKAESSSQLVLTANNVDPVRFDHFTVNANQKTLTAEQTVPPGYEGMSFNADLLFSGNHLEVKPNPVTLQKTTFLQTVLGGESPRRAWTVALDAASNAFANQAQDMYTKEILVFTHDSPNPLESVILHNYDTVAQPLVYMEIEARIVERNILDGLMQQWTRPSLTNVNSDGYRAYLDKRFEEYKEYGVELAARRFTNDSYNLPGQGSRFQRGNISIEGQQLLPRIGVPGGMPSDKAMIVLVDSWWKPYPHFQQSGTELTLSQTFEPPTRRALFGVSSGPERQIDLSVVRTQYKQNLVIPVQKIGDAQIMKGTNSVTIDLNELGPASVMQVFWSWKPSP